MVNNNFSTLDPVEFPLSSKQRVRFDFNFLRCNWISENNRQWGSRGRRGASGYSCIYPVCLPNLCGLENAFKGTLSIKSTSISRPTPSPSHLPSVLGEDYTDESFNAQFAEQKKRLESSYFIFCCFLMIVENMKNQLLGNEIGERFTIPGRYALWSAAPHRSPIVWSDRARGTNRVESREG